MNNKIEELVQCSYVYNNIDLFITSNTWFECLGYNSTWINSTFLDIPKIKTNERVIYPNPTTSIINLKNQEGKLENINYFLCNFQGALVQQGNINQNSIDISERPNGIFYLKVQNFKEHYNEIIIKQ